MTWWYRWLCRLSGVLGAVCEYTAWARGGPAAPCACAPPRSRPVGWGLRVPRWTRRRWRRPGGCYGYRRAAEAPEFPGWAGSSGDIPGGNLSSLGECWARRGPGTAPPPLPEPGAGNAASAPGLSVVGRGRLQGPALPSPEAAAPVDLVWVGAVAAVTSVPGAAFPEGQVLRGDRWPPSPGPVLS